MALGPVARGTARAKRPAGAGPVALRIAFASDLHLGPTTSSRTLDTAFELLTAARPDLLALGGDYVFLRAKPPMTRELSRRLAAVPARCRAAVLGNHDLWTDHRLIEQALREAGVRVLVNQALRLPPPHQAVALLGIDEPWTGHEDVAAACAQAGDAALRIALCHSPDVLPALQGRDVSLLLCGHTHGGQLALPGGHPLWVPGGVGARYPHGVHRVGGLTLVVSRGVGGIEIPLRCWAPPDVVLVDLVAR